MTLARRLRFRASLMKVGVDGAVRVARDKATSYGYSLTGRKTAPATDFDPFSAQIMHDPYPGYQSLLTGTEVPGVWYNRKRGIWIIAGYDDVRKALRDNEELSSAQSQSRFRVHLPSMNAADPPEHTRLRKFVSRAFTARAMTAWQTNINEVADELVDTVIARAPHRGGRRTRQTAADPADRQDARHPAAGSAAVRGVVGRDGRGRLRAVDPARHAALRALGKRDRGYAPQPRPADRAATPESR